MRAERIFDGPTDRLEAITLTVRDLLDALCNDLLRRQSGARRVIVTLFRSDMPPLTLAVRLSRPSRDARHLWSLIESKVEQAHLGYGVEGVRLTAGSVTRIAHEQKTQWVKPPCDSASEELGRLVDTLTSRLGVDRVVRLTPRESHIPERAFISVPVAGAAPARNSASLPSSPRPSLLFDRPRPIEVTLMRPEGPLMLLRGSDGSQRVRHCIGPERIGGDRRMRVRGRRDDHRIHAGFGQQAGLVLGGIQGRYLDVQHDLARVLAEGHDNRGRLLAAGPLDKLGQQVLMPEVHAVEAADADHRTRFGQALPVSAELLEAVEDVRAMGQISACRLPCCHSCRSRPCRAASHPRWPA